MRLYLSSFRVGDRPDELVRMAGAGARVALIANSCDGAPADVRADAVAGEHERLGALGLRTEEVDLRDFFDGRGHLASVIAPYDVLWLRGGNVFTLRYAMRASGLDDLVLAGLRADGFVYAGYSAGPCVLAPSLRGLEACDSADEVAELHGVPPVFEGLGILDRPFVPHLDSPGHPETELLAAVSARYTADGVEHWQLRDGQVLVVDGDLAGAQLF
jgi:dipeptidase E